MIVKEHTRNQKRMYRIHKLEERVQKQDLLIGSLQQENKNLKEEIKGYQKMYFDKVMIINKAIEYIGSKEMYNDDFDTETNKLLDLLKGNKEE